MGSRMAMKTTAKFYLLQFRFLLFAGMYLFLLFGSIYGLFLDQISIPFSFNPLEYLVFQGGPKILLCLTVFFLVAALTALPFLMMILRALSHAGDDGEMSEMDQKRIARKILLIIIIFFVLLLAGAFWWQIIS